MMQRDVVHILSSLGRGGIETWLMNVFRTSQPIRDRSVICLIGEAPSNPGSYFPELTAMNIPIYYVSFSFSALPFIIKLRNLLKELKPKVVHCHMNYLSGFATFPALTAGIPVRLAHYHVAFPHQHKTLLRYTYIQAVRFLEGITATDVIGCSQLALDSYPKFPFRVKRRKEKILYYGIDPSPFKTTIKKKLVRDELGIPRDAFVIGHVGRFVEQKNHHFLIQIVAEVVRQEPKAQLLLVGDGPLRPSIEQQVAEMGLSDHVIFAGLRSDVPRLMLGAMDMFVFPSFYEGLGLVLVEAQAAGLPCVYSDIIPEEAIVVPKLAQTLSLNQTSGQWARAVLAYRSQHTIVSQHEAFNCVQRSHFNIKQSVCDLMTTYHG